MRCPSYRSYLFVLVAAALSCGMILAPRLLAPRKHTAVKEMPYESGMDPIHDARRRFAVRFHLVAIAFLVFDVELLFLYPWAVATRAHARAAQLPRGIDQAVAEGWISNRGLVFAGAMVFIRAGRARLHLRLAERNFQMAIELPENVVVSKLDALASWCRKNSLWPMPFATACCGIELMATGASKHDIARFGAEVFRFSPRQCDLMIVAGRVVMKMLPVLQRIWQQMNEPKWCISMGACASHRRRVRYLLRRAGHRSLHSGRYVRARLPAAAGAVDSGDHRSARQNSARRDDRRPRISTPRLGSSRSGHWSS